MNLAALNDTVLLDPEPAMKYDEYKDLKHIVLPEKFEHGPIDPPRWGKVVAKGETCCNPKVHVGDRILFGKFAGAKIHYDRHDYFAVREDDLLLKDESA